MPAWAWVLIGIGVVVVLAAIAWQLVARRRTGRLQSRFGDEYDRTVESADSRRLAEAELQAREERRERLDIRPLTPTARARYVEMWRVTQAQFVDEPREAVTAADRLIQSVMSDRGYPVEDFDQRAADVSVDHPQVVENYRAGHRLATATSDGPDATEELRQAMHHYRALFDELVEPVADEPMSAERSVSTADVRDPQSVR